MFSLFNCTRGAEGSSLLLSDAERYELVIKSLREKRQRARHLKQLATRGESHYWWAHEQNTAYLDMSPLNPTRHFLHFCSLCKRFVYSPAFTNYMLVCIVSAGALVGLQTYPHLTNDPVLEAVDTIILVSFTLELALKILAEGLGPWWFLLGPERNWNLFDSAIVLLSMPYITISGSTGQAKLLRLVRLMRLAKVFKRIEKLNMIMTGLAEGMKSIFYILVLLLLSFYLYACAGIVLFRDNASWHWHSIEISMLTLLGVATFDNWGEYLNVSYYGCDVYPSSVYTTDVTQRDPDNALGGTMWCQQPEAQPLAAALFYYSFLALCSFCVLSLFVSSVAGAMTEAMLQMRAEQERRRLARALHHIDSILKEFVAVDPNLRSRKNARMAVLFDAAFRGKDMAALVLPVDRSLGPLALYRRLGIVCGDVAAHAHFTTFITAVILAAGVTVGMSTDPGMARRYGAEIALVDSFILYTFVAEAGMKIVAEGVTPWKYFADAWNCFDFLIVALSLALAGGSDASIVTVLRLLRLLRVLKLMHAISELQVIVSALLSGLSSMAYILVILCVFYYFFGVIAVTFLGANDPFHFATLHMALLSLFQVTTFDGWYATMTTTLYGCLRQPGNYPALCSAENNNAQFVLGALFFVAVAVVGGLVLLTLFIGVVSMSMEEASADERRGAEVLRRSRLIADVERLSEAQFHAYKECFDLLDLTHSSKIGREEFKFGMVVAGFSIDDDSIDDIWRVVDRDGSAGIDFAEFLEFVMDLRAKLGDSAASPGANKRRSLSLGQAQPDSAKAKAKAAVGGGGKFGTGSGNNPYFGSRTAPAKVAEEEDDEGEEEGEGEGEGEEGKDGEDGKREEDEQTKDEQRKEGEANLEGFADIPSTPSKSQPPAASPEQQRQQAAIQSVHDEALHAYTRAQAASALGGKVLVTLKPVLRRDGRQAPGAGEQHTPGGPGPPGSPALSVVVVSAGDLPGSAVAAPGAPSSPFSAPSSSSSSSSSSSCSATAAAAKYVAYAGPRSPDGPFARPGGQPFLIPVPAKAEAAPEPPPPPRSLLARARDGLLGWIGREERERREREERERAERERRGAEERLLHELAAVKVVRKLVVGV